MTWIKELYNKTKLVYFPDDKGNEHSVEIAIKLNDYDSAVLEKNKEIENKCRKKKMSVRDYEYLRDEMARAFREQVELSKRCGSDDK